MTEPADSEARGEGASPPSPRGPMNWFIDFIELVAAFFIGIVALDIFISVMLSYFFSVQIPDAYDFGGPKDSKTGDRQAVATALGKLLRRALEALLREEAASRR